jgi:ankyrin repeat protein
LNCSSNISPTTVNPSNSNKRLYSDVFENDEVRSDYSNSNQMENDEQGLSSIQDYISTAQESSSIRSDDRFSLLNDAIRRGDTNMALGLIDQTNHFLQQENEEGDTPLLLAARLNRCQIITVILKKQPDLAQQTDRQENNLLHLLAGVPEDKAKDAVKNILEKLENKTKKSLLLMSNKTGQIPRQIAETHGNNQCIDLLKRKMTSLDNSV